MRKLYKVYGNSVCIPCTDLLKAMSEYNNLKKQIMVDECSEDSLVEIILYDADDEYDDGISLIEERIRFDVERTIKESPRDLGYNFDSWAKWEIEKEVEVEYV